MQQLGVPGTLYIASMQHPHCWCSLSGPNIVTNVPQLLAVACLTHLLVICVWAPHPSEMPPEDDLGSLSEVCPLRLLSSFESQGTKPALPVMVMLSPILSWVQNRANSPVLCQNYPLSCSTITPPTSGLHPTSGLLSFMTVYPKSLWIIHTIRHFGFEPIAFYKIKQALANSAILLAQAIPGSTLRWVLLLGPWGGFRVVVHTTNPSPFLCDLLPPLPSTYSNSWDTFYEGLRHSSNQEAFHRLTLTWLSRTGCQALKHALTQLFPQ